MPRDRIRASTQINRAQQDGLPTGRAIKFADVEFEPLTFEELARMEGLDLSKQRADSGDPLAEAHKDCGMCGDRIPPEEQYPDAL